VTPLILTLVMDAASQGFFERERQRYFPTALNMIPAHVTLFHHLPGDGVARIEADLIRLCQDEQPSPFTVEGLRFLGRGVAYTVHAPGVARLRERLAKLWRDDLTAQDRQGWRPHVTIQNKVHPADAKALCTRLSGDFTPFEATACGVALWRYLGGPWEPLSRFTFG
jgi:hypothetical protein